MSASATQLIHAAAGEPPYPVPERGVCRLCGAESGGLPFAPWVKDTFTNHDLLRPGSIICAACQFTFDDHSALLQALLGRDKPQRMRNYSHFVVDGRWLPLHKGQKAQMLDALRRTPAVAVVAYSGQKQLAFRARPGWWQLEELTVLPDVPRLDACLAHIEALYRIFSKGEIESGAWLPHRMMEYAQSYGMDALLAAQRALEPHRGAPAFELALFLAQKETDDGPAGVPPAVPHRPAPADSALARPRRRLQESLFADDLDAV